MEPLSILYFTDLLCIWAYVGQVRVDRLCAEQGDNVHVDGRFCAVFGDVERKWEAWSDRGGAKGYGDHVRNVAADFEHVTVHEDVWSCVQPLSSMPCHLFLCAIRRLEREGRMQPGAFTQSMWALRRAFFVEARDISHHRVQCEVAESLGIPRGPVEELLESGAAHAELSRDATLTRQYDVQLSPTLVLNEGRQRLCGNVGYRVIDANVRELLHKRGVDEASWC